MAKQTRPQLVIAVEGVLTSDPLERFWDLVATAVNGNAAEVEMLFRQELADPLFTGQVPEREFWRWLGKRLGLTDQRFWQTLLAERHYPLLAMHLLPRLASQANIYLLCGECSEWFLPLIEDEDLGFAVSRMIFTDQVGISKDSSELWTKLRNGGGSGPGLLIDVDQRALELGREAGFTTLRADRRLQWVEVALGWLDQRTSSSGWSGLVKRKSPAFLRRISQSLRGRAS